jgi:hypothetical protein
MLILFDLKIVMLSLLRSSKIQLPRAAYESINE